MSNKTIDLGTGSVSRLLFSLSIPAIAAQIINVLYNMVDRAYLGHIPEVGDLALTGVGVTMPIIMAISAFAALIGMGSAPRAGIMMGKKDYETAEKILGNSLFTLVIISILLTGGILLFARPILMIFGASDNTIGYALDYINIYAIGTIFVQITLGMNVFISTQGFAKISMVTVAIGAIINIILDPILIFGLNMGVKGAALATILSQAISCTWVLSFLYSKKSRLRIKKENIRFDRKIIFPCLALGVSPFIMQFTEAILAICFNTSLLKYGGDIAVGAMTILSSIMQLSMLPLQGLTQGAQPIMSFNYGAGNIDRVKETFKVLLICCLGFSTSIWAVCMFAPDIFIRIFASKPELLDFTRWAVRIYMATSCIFGIQIACQQSFIAMGNARSSLFLALLRKAILLIPLIIILPHFFENKVMAVFLAEPIADFIAVVTTALLFSWTYRRLDEHRFSY